MAFWEEGGADTSDSALTEIGTNNQLVADPFTPSNLTLTEIIASTSEDWAGFYVTVQRQNGARGLINVCTGAAGSEVSVAILPVKAATKNELRHSIYIPIPIASGTRISAGCSAQSISFSIEIQVAGIPSSNFSADPPFTKLESGPYDLQNDSATYGAWPLIDPGATPNTKGSYTELSESDTNGSNNVLNGDSLAQSYDYLGFVIGDNENFSNTTQNRLVDLAYGAASSEVNFVENAGSYVTTLEVGGPHNIWIPWGRASGDRISARGQSSTADVTDRIFDCLLFGLR